MIAIPKSLAGIAADRIRRRIVDGSLDFGQQITEGDLARQLGLSKTPVREALLRLEAEHLVVIRPRRGTFVFTPDEEDLSNLCVTRIALEQEALRQAMQRNPARLMQALERYARDGELLLEGKTDLRAYLRTDFAFHLAILNCARNPYLLDAHRYIATKVQAIRYRQFYGSAFVERSIEEHSRLCVLAAEDDVRTACELVAEHIRHVFSPEAVAVICREARAPR